MDVNINIFWAVYLFLVGSVVWYGKKRYKTYLNVLSVAVFITSTYTFFGKIYYYTAGSCFIEPKYIAKTILISTVSLLGFLVPFLVSTRWLFSVYCKSMRLLKIDTSKRIPLLNRILLFGLLMGGSICFVGLAVKGGGGLLWLTDPRNAYMDFRRGAGYLYAMTQWFLVSAFIVYLWLKRPNGMHALSALIVVCAMGYFLGSKGFIIRNLIIFIFYYNYLIRPIKTMHLVLGGLSICFTFLAIQLFQGTAKDLVNTLHYFVYFDTTAKFLSRIDEVGFQYGKAFISSFWAYVPRSLVSSKPIVYGQYMVHELLNPGLLERGRAAGILPWTRYYLDFGVFGVFAAALFDGIVAKVTFEYYRLQRWNPFAFIIMFQLSIMSIINYAPFFLFVTWLIIISFYIRLGGRSYKFPALLWSTKKRRYALYCKI